jgi:hypothetical protein
MNLAVQTVSYFAVVTLGAMSPGPDFAVVTRHSIFGGRLSADTPTAKGMPARSDRAWIFEPGLAAVDGVGAGH